MSPIIKTKKAEMKNYMLKRRWMALVAVCVLLTGCRKKEEPQLPIVMAEKPSRQDVHIFGEYVGRIRAASYGYIPTAWPIWG
jgi:membrane fusion protein (multidrug efflux system)